MAGQVIKPDLDFIKGVIASGGESLKKCYQCATCSVVCNVTPDKKPFPRKEMIWAQWGLKEKFIGNPDIWLCHQCNDCTVYCPRGAKPGEVLGAIRKQAIQQYSVPDFMVRFVNNRRSVVFLFLIPAVVFLIILSITGTLRIPEGEIVFSEFFPLYIIDILFSAALIFSIAVGVLGVRRFWLDMKQAYGCPSCSIANLKNSIIGAIKDILSHGKFKNCIVNKDRYLAHLLVFYSFIALAITTGLAAFYLYILGIESPYPLLTPVKLIGNIGAIGLLVGITLVTINRVKNRGRVGIGSYFDWLLIFIIYMIVCTGILSEITRLADVPGLAYPIYFFHLVFVFSLFLYLPYSKLAHLFYRTAAICYAKYSGREVMSVRYK